ncbi:MAG: ATP-binding protein [Candidatus Omnitrophica bacterium]|nr:ATP-binding protein [Candidatus Omnitrophota bacterium]
MKNEKIKELMYFYCPWWVSNKVSDNLSLDFKRHIIKTFFRYLTLNRILIIKGPRRTGKTTIIYQMIDILIHKNIPPKNILYLSFDDPELRINLNEILSAYEEILGSTLAQAKQLYFFLDEVQFMENWQFTIKKYFDRKYPIKFIISGSSASLVHKDTESLAGRTIEHIILPFNFTEYIDYTLKDEKIRDIITEFKKTFSFFKLPDITRLIPYQRNIFIAFNHYISWGGFPHIFEITDEILKYKLLREDVIEKIIYRDLVELFGIKKPFVLEKLFLYLAEHSSEILNISNISNTLQLSREYIEKYIDYLKQAYIIKTIKKYSSSVEKMLRSNVKCFLIDNGLIKISGSEVPIGKLVETIISGHLSNREIFYWRDKEEVDFIIKEGNNIIPIEIKYKNHIEKKDIMGLFKFTEQYQLKSAIVISKDILEQKKINGLTVLFIPAWLFVLSVDDITYI